MEVTQPHLTRPYCFRGTGGEKLLCIVPCSVSVTVLTYRPVFPSKSTGREILSRSASPGLVLREQSPGSVGCGGGCCQLLGQGWGAPARRGTSSRSFGTATVQRRFLLRSGVVPLYVQNDSKSCCQSFSLRKEWSAFSRFQRWLLNQTQKAMCFFWGDAVG